MNILINEGLGERNEYLVDILTFFIDPDLEDHLQFRGNGYVSSYNLSRCLGRFKSEFMAEYDADMVSRVEVCFKDPNFMMSVTYSVFSKLADLISNDSNIVVDLVSLVLLQIESELETFEPCV